MIKKLPLVSVVEPITALPSERRVTSIPLTPTCVSPPITVPESV